MAEKKSNCGCGCIPQKQNSEKPAKDKKKAKKSKQVEHCTVPPKGMGMQRKIPIPFDLFTELFERRCRMNLWILTLSRLLHVLGTVVWIGGILMTLLVILPGSKAALESAPMVGLNAKSLSYRRQL